MPSPPRLSRLATIFNYPKIIVVIRSKYRVDSDSDPSNRAESICWYCNGLKSMNHVQNISRYPQMYTNLQFADRKLEGVERHKTLQSWSRYSVNYRKLTNTTRFLTLVRVRDGNFPIFSSPLSTWINKVGNYWFHKTSVGNLPTVVSSSSSIECEVLDVSYVIVVKEL